MWYKNFIGVIILLATSCVNGKKIKIGKMNITYATFIPFANTKLNGAKLLTEHAETLSECVKKCEEHTNCQSANFEAKWCELLSDNKYVSKEKLETLSGSIHFAKMNRGCNEKKCQNNATCVPDYEQNTYSCNCKPGFTGKFCEVMFSPTPDWWFKFDGGTENDGLKPNDASIIPVYNAKDKAIFLGQPHRKGKYMSCLSACTISNISWPGWSNPEYSDISIALWIQFPPAHLMHKESYESTVTILGTRGRGIKVYYRKPENTWKFEVFLSDNYYCSTIPSSNEETKKWTFLAMSWRHGRLSGFVNDVEVTQTHKGNGLSAQGENMQLFHPYIRSIINIDEFRVWYHAKSPAFIRQLYNNEKADIWH